MIWNITGFNCYLETQFTITISNYHNYYHPEVLVSNILPYSDNFFSKIMNN